MVPYPDGSIWFTDPRPMAASLMRASPMRRNPRIGRIRLPESAANLCFGGAKRNRLFMAASQSLYAVYVRTQGAAPG